MENVWHYICSRTEDTCIQIARHCVLWFNTRWFKYDQDDLCVNKSVCPSHIWTTLYLINVGGLECYTCWNNLYWQCRHELFCVIVARSVVLWLIGTEHEKLQIMDWQYVNTELVHSRCINSVISTHYRAQLCLPLV